MAVNRVPHDDRGATPDMRPTDLWTLANPGGHRARATLLPQGKMIILAWFVDDKPEGVEDFTDWDAAMRRAGELRMALAAASRS
jgi:hypothetical protein